MYSANFDYFRANSVAEAVDLLKNHPGARLLAGGHSLLPQMKLRVAQPPALVDIGRLSELRGITHAGDKLHIGALTTHNTIATSEVVKQHCAVLAHAAGLIGDQQVRNRGTIGGSVAHADPAADLPTVLLALQATLTAVGPGGAREIAADDFVTDLFTTVLQEGEVLTQVTVPAYGMAEGAAYKKHEHPASGYAVVGAAAMVMLASGQCSGARIAVGGVTAKPVSASAAEAALMGKPLDEANIAAAAALVAGAITDPIGDHYASAEYRIHLATVLARKAIAKAAKKAGA
jgi:carbon-monoxide dehydrogenase medium subunit